MKAERNKFASGLKICITGLSEVLPPGQWRRYAIVLADAISEIGRLESENAGLREKVKFLTEDRDYWQHKWGNGSA